ncbi:MAG: hypothetical protein K9K37_07910 [Desulfocapsa sp.]|nr:hypothetical protein [Desulfocapsa sp.]
MTIPTTAKENRSIMSRILYLFSRIPFTRAASKTAGKVDERTDKKRWKRRLSNRVARDLQLRIMMVREDQEAMLPLIELAHENNKEAVIWTLINDDDMYQKFTSAALFNSDYYLELAYPALAAIKTINETLQQTTD